MKDSRVKHTIAKFLGREADVHELEELEVWLKNNPDHTLFNQFAKLDYLITFSMADYDINKAKTSIKNKIRNEGRTRKRTLYARMAVATSVLLLVATAFFFTYTTSETATVSSSEQHNIAVGSDRAILTLEDGSQIALEKGKSFKTEKADSNGQELIYKDAQKADSKVSKNISYNYLTIPRGGQYFVQLSDNTKIWLNSDSKLKYPTNFPKGQERIVELLYGEAYFEVSSSTENHGSKFRVISKSQNVEVLGTEFNIKAYDGEDFIETTLAEGKVKVANGQESIKLNPGQQSRIGTDEGSIQILEVDVLQEISWKNGLFIFEEEPLHEIMKVLSRWYDAEVFFQNDALRDFTFTGVLERTKSIDAILDLIGASSDGQLKFKVLEDAVLIQ